MPIPNAILDTQSRLKQAMLAEDDRERRSLLASAKASIDWLIDHYQTAKNQVDQIRLERSTVP